MVGIGLLIVLALFIAGKVVYWYGHDYQPQIKFVPQKVDVSEEIFAAKIEKLKWDVVEKLRACESAGYKESDGILIFDTNQVASIGTLQFQKKTVVYYYKALYQKVITGKEAVLIALDDKLAGELARDIMFKSKNIASDWYNCSTRLNLENEILIIKKLEAK